MANPFAALKGTTKGKLGPLPIWAWGVILGVIVLGAYYYEANKKKAAGAAVVSATTSGDNLAAGLNDNTSVDPTDGLTGLDSSGGLGTSSGTVAGSQTNAAWEASAVAWLSSHGYTPLVAQSALEAYLGGTLDSTNSNYVAAVNAAVQNFGLPPEGTFSAPTVTDAPATGGKLGDGWYLINGGEDTGAYYQVTNGVRRSQGANGWKAAGSPALSTITSDALGAGSSA